MTRDDAYALLDFIQARVFGWTVAIGCNNPSGRMDGRFKSVKLADRVLRDAYLTRTDLDECIAAFERGEDPALQWPEPYQDFIRFVLWHRCPRSVNEPLGKTKRHERHFPREWPEFLHKYNKPATVNDLPPLPGPSEALLELERSRA